jgi:hypothetical protein
MKFSIIHRFCVTVTYYGLYDQHGITSDSVVYVDMNMSLYPLGSATFGKQISQLGKPMFNATLYDMKGITVCHESMTATGDNYACPTTGQYAFQSSVTVPQPGGNAFKTWMYTGYNGTGELAIYAGQGYGSTLLGYCSFTLSTEQEKTVGIKTASGRDAMVGVLSAVAVMFVLGLICCWCTCNRTQKKSVVQKVVPFISPEEKIGGHFRIMEEETLGEANKHWQIDDGAEKERLAKVPSRKGWFNV